MVQYSITQITFTPLVKTYTLETLIRLTQPSWFSPLSQPKQFYLATRQSPSPRRLHRVSAPLPSSLPWSPLFWSLRSSFCLWTNKIWFVLDQRRRSGSFSLVLFLSVSNCPIFCSSVAWTKKICKEFFFLFSSILDFWSMQSTLVPLSDFFFFWFLGTQNVLIQSTNSRTPDPLNPMKWMVGNGLLFFFSVWIELSHLGPNPTVVRP